MRRCREPHRLVGRPGSSSSRLRTPITARATMKYIRSPEASTTVVTNGALKTAGSIESTRAGDRHKRSHEGSERADEYQRQRDDQCD